MDHKYPNQHSAYFLQIVHEAETAIKVYEPQAQLVQLRGELNNIRQAWQWALRTGR